MNNFRTEKKKVKIEECVINPWNPNVMSKEMFEKEVNSIKELGLLGSILVRELSGCYQIIDGEHRWKACKELGYTDITVESLGEIDDNQTKVLTILLNNLHGEDDIEKRAAVFEQLNQGQLQLLPFTQEEIDNTKALFKFDFTQYAVEDEEQKKIISITIRVSEKTKELWDQCVQVAKDDKKELDLVLYEMFDEWLQLSSLEYVKDMP